MMPPSLLRLLALSVGLALFSALAADEAVLARLGTVSLTSGEMKKLIDAEGIEAKSQLAASGPDLDRVVRSELVRRSVLAEARAKGFDKRPEVVAQMERARDQALVAAYANHVSRPTSDYPPASEVEVAYRSNLSAFTTPTQYHVAQIFVKIPDGADKAKAEAASKKADELLQKVLQPKADFAAIAKTGSEHTASAPTGGDLGWLGEAQLVPEVRSVVLQLQPGQVSGVLKTAQGFHIVKLLERKDIQVQPLAEVKDRLVSALRLRKAQENEQKYLSEITAKTPPTVDEAEMKKLQSSLR